MFCLEDGTFGPNSKPSCERVPCGDPPSLTHGSFTATSVTGGPARFVFEDVATYTCNSGYELQVTSPDTTLTCNDQGAWTPHAPSPCHPVSCGVPAFPIHTITTGSEYTFGQTVKYSCETGYYLVGFPVLTCTANRQWSPSDAPTCASVPCGHPSKIQHGSYTNEQSTNELHFTYQRNVTYSCESGYELHVNPRAGESATMTCQANGNWDAMTPTCPPVSCGQPQPIRNGHVNGSVFSYGNEVTYGCNVGYEMTSEPVKTCQADKTWTGPVPICSPVSCDRPPHVEHSQYTLTPALTYGNSVSYQCDAGYDMSGFSTLTCTAARVYDLPSPVCIPVSCGEPGAVANGRITDRSGAVTFGHNVTYACDIGYELRSGAASKTIRCTAARSWSDLPPICDPVSCGKPASIEHGNVASTANTYLSIAEFTCNPGYELGGSGTGDNCKPGHTCLICQADKLWGTGSGGHPTHPVHCSPLSCVEPTGISNGRVSVTSYLYLSTLEYICDEGYELHPESSQHLQCQTNYEWGPQAPPTCRRIACPDPTPIENGQFSLVRPPTSSRTDVARQYLFEDLVQYNCHSGYRFDNTGLSESVGTLFCLATGSWDQVHPVCEPVPCGIAPPREHGHLVGDVSQVFVYSETASYACDTGFEFIGDSTEEAITCTANGQWSSNSPPACHPVTCGPDPHVTNGMVNTAEGGTNLRRIFGSAVTYACLHGYYMTATDTINCGSDRQWSPKAPQCHPVPCGPLPTVAHASPLSFVAPPALLRSFVSFTASGSGSGDAPWATTSSDVAAEPVPPDATARFSSNGDSGVEPVPPDAVRQRKRRSAGGYTYGDTVHYQCDFGYRPTQGSVEFTSCGANGEWMRPFPQCEPIPCDPLPPIANGRRIGNKFTFGQQISYACNQGYESSSRDTFVCKADGRFHVDSEINSETAAGLNSLPTCERVSCGATQGVVNGIVKSSNTEYLFTDKLRYECLPGYNLRGEFELTCQANKAFDHPPPTCDPVSCGNPPTLPNTQQHVTSTVYRGTATYTCSKGYVNLEDTITCQADGLWSSTSLLCAKVDCGSSPALNFGYVDINGTKYGDVAVYHCRSGYIRSGSFQRNCLANGSWSGACPACTPVDCGPPTDPINGQHIAQGNYTFGEIVLYSCNTGYVLVGESFTLCTASTNWSAPVPTCERISCGATPFATNGAHDQPPASEHRFGDQITYQCDYGYEYGASLMLTCGSDGLFDNLPPACTPRNCGSPPAHANAELTSAISGGVVYGGRATYRCVTGHVSGSDVINVTCRGDATFSDPSDQCVPVQCPTLPDVVHGSMSMKSGQYGDDVTFTCDEGYALFGPTTISCLAEAVWSDAPPHCPPVQCGTAPPVSNGVVVDEQPVYTFGMIAHYNCERGYEHAYGGKWRSKTCQSNGNFSTENVACLPVECPELPPFFNGRSDYGSIKYGARGVLTCDEGYQLGTEERSLNFTCQADRSWSVNFDTIACSPVPCTSLPAVTHADITEVKTPHDMTSTSEAPAGLVFGDAVQYKCQTGYYLEGVEELNCLSNGTWSSPTPSCLPVVCGQAPQIDNAHVADATHTFGMTAEYQCHLGHVVASDTMSRVCQADGSFSTHPVTCVPKSCGEVPAILHGTASATAGVFNDVITFQCDSGYDRLGLESIRCGSDGLWSSGPPSCNPVPCGDVTHIVNANTTSTGTNFGDVVTLTCNVGYHLSTGEDSIELHCQANRTWSRDVTSTTCDPVPCEFISGINNGAITVVPPLRKPVPKRRRAAEGHITSHHYGTKLRFTCNSGYTLGGSDVIECLSNRLWSGPPAACNPVQCHNPPALSNAKLTTTSHVFGQRAEYSCVDGHSLRSSGNFRTCNADGNFSSHEVTCSPVPCTSLPQVKHARVVSISGSNPVFGDLADTVCDEGYSLAGPGEFECLATGEWSNIEPTCQPNVCGTAPAVNNAHVVADPAVVYSYGDTVTYKCDQGYSLVGSDVTRTCGANGEFDNLPIQCDRVTCPEIPPMDFASMQSTGSAFGDENRITCDAGYQLENGNKEIILTCLHKGDWSEDWRLIWCVGITCDPLKSFEHGTVDHSLAEMIGENFVYPSTVVYNCNVGYTLEGRSKQKCNADGSWAGDTPTCNPVDCGLPSQPTNGYTRGDKTTTLGSVVSYHCDKGFTLWPPEESTRRCTEIGSWSGSDPTCEVVSCFVDFAVDHGTLTPSIFVEYGGHVAVKCDDGYEINGNSTRSCRDDGFFDGTTPTCNPISCGVHPPVPNAIIEPAGEVQFGNELNITCLPGYSHINGDLQRSCQHNRTWSGKHPTCDQPFRFDNIMERSELLPCGPPPIEGKNVKLKHNAEMQSFYDPYVTLKFRCLNGYIPSTNLTITCLSGFWSGEPQCSSKCKHICLNRGTCSSRGSCNCPRGWTGSRCHRPVCILPCLNRGYCSAAYTCTCQPGWTGSRCQTPVCDRPCQNGGRCESPNRCRCPRGYQGDDCSQSSYFNFW
uniref:Sushi, von Willebrand factor type A, EGF and pentraxin domain-containing protein 1-like n=1 Tax=Phallusia mammillata TaxID=59560 RepID=A0A6F9DTI4_9ASCI|nr:sushi, von Willebrand factor type A, EGF and pentraxin domain-containing protein 1-like [Phallusia mammillata]